MAKTLSENELYTIWSTRGTYRRETKRREEKVEKKTKEKAKRKQGKVYAYMCRLYIDHIMGKPRRSSGADSPFFIQALIISLVKKF